MTIGVDLDHMLFSYPKFFQEFFSAFQASNKVGIITARSHEQKEAVLKKLAGIDIYPDFFVGMPEGSELSPGVFKAQVCKELEVAILFDDFMCSDPKMLADFFSVNPITIPFTSWAYSPDQT